MSGVLRLNPWVVRNAASTWIGAFRRECRLEFHRECSE